MVKTAIIGASGYIGRHLLAAYRESYPEAIGTAFSARNDNLTHFDIRQPDITPLRLEEQGYQAVLIAAAKPHVGFCEDNREAAHAVNVAGTVELVRQIGKTSLQTIFLSTDYVFEGTAGGYSDSEPAAPTTEYGRQKAHVERTIPTLTDNYLILRLSKIYGTEKGDKTLLDEIAGSLAAGRMIQCAKDQFFCPTYIDDLTAAIMRIQSRKLKGILNLCSNEIWSRYDIASKIAEEMRADLSLVKSISLHDLPSMAGRPLNTSMKCSALDLQEFVPLKRNISIVARNWAEELIRS